MLKKYVDWMFCYIFFVIQTYLCNFVCKIIKYYWYIKETME